MFPTNKVVRAGGSCERIIMCSGTSSKRAPIIRCGKPSAAEYAYPDGKHLLVCLEHDIEVHSELRALVGTPRADALLWRIHA